MKTPIIMLTIIPLLMLNAASLSHEEISMMVEKIKKERAGISGVTLERTPNPFAIVKKVTAPIVKEEVVEEVVEVKEPEPTYELLAILNHAAFIAGKWYKVGDKLEPYTIYSIGKDSIMLKRGKETKILTIPERKNKIIFKGN